jgi:hypothetical protein
MFYASKLWPFKIFSPDKERQQNWCLFNKFRYYKNFCKKSCTKESRKILFFYIFFITYCSLKDISAACFLLLFSDKTVIVWLNFSFWFLLNFWELRMQNLFSPMIFYWIFCKQKRFRNGSSDLEEINMKFCCFFNWYGFNGDTKNRLHPANMQSKNYITTRSGPAIFDTLSFRQIFFLLAKPNLCETFMFFAPFEKNKRKKFQRHFATSLFPFFYL